MVWLRRPKAPDPCQWGLCYGWRRNLDLALIIWTEHGPQWSLWRRWSLLFLLVRHAHLVQRRYLGETASQESIFQPRQVLNAISIMAICWQLITVVFLSFPLYRPVTTTNMNWGSVCAVVGLSLSALNWFLYARTHYHAPKALYVEALHGHGAESLEADTHPKLT